MKAWAERWLDRFEAPTAAASRRVGQGRAWSRSGRVTDVRVRRGEVSGSVQGHRATPYPVTISVTPLSDESWSRAVAVLAANVGLSARLLAGQVPEALEDELTTAGVRLFPGPEEVSGHCGCGDTARACAHVQAVAYALAERLTADPFVLVRLRGRGRERLVAELQAVRHAGGRQPSRVAVATLDANGFAAGGDLTARRLTAEPEGPTLAMLGDPPGWPTAGPGAVEMFRPLLRAAVGWLEEVAGE